MLRRVCLAVIAFAFAPTFAVAQVVSGEVTDSTNRPISGVVVMLLDARSQPRARALTDERGEFRIAAPASGSYSLRTLRIGFRPATTAPIELRAGDEVMRHVVVAGLPITLDTVRVADRSACKAFADAGAATFAVWEQVRGALTATELTTELQNIAATTVVYERVLDPRGNNRVLQQKATLATGYVNRPWLSLPPDSLRRIGYVVTGRDNSVMYYAPGIDALLSSSFANDHCFRIAEDPKRTDLIGLAFEPTPERKHTAEISGTIWVDRASSLLRQLEFKFVNVPLEQETAGGDLHFARMRDGTWAITDWDIRMPAFTSVVVPGHGAERQLAEIQVAGGQLALARRGTDTLWAEPTVALSGTIRDSASGAGIAGAHLTLIGTQLGAQTDDRGRFSLPGMLPGLYDVEIRTPSLDSLGATHRASFKFLDPNSHPDWRVPNAQQLMATVCGSSLRDGTRGILIGRARASGDLALHNLSVIAEWPDSQDVVRQARIQGGADGSFRMCGVPTNTALRLRATAEDAETPRETTVRLQGGTRMARTELTLVPLATLAARGAVFTGVVVADSTHTPIPLAEVAFPELNKSETTNPHGEFRISGIPAGEYRISVRRIGYGAADAKLAFKGNETVERRVVLGRAVTLEPVKVVATARDMMRASFDENKAVGLGHFMTRDQIEKYDGMELATLLSTISSTAIAYGKAHNWISSRRRPPPPLCLLDYLACMRAHGFHIPDEFEGQQGLPIECWALVWVDGVLQNGMHDPTEPFDLKEVAPFGVDKLEFYANDLEAPLKYQRRGSQCGVLVIWRRQYEPKPDKP